MISHRSRSILVLGLISSLLLISSSASSQDAGKRAAAKADTGMGKLIEKWTAGNADVRRNVTGEILFRWKEWKKADLGALDKVSKGKTGLSKWARDVRHRIRVRSWLGAKLLKSIKGLEQVALRGNEGDRVRVLREGARLLKQKKLDNKELKQLGKVIVPKTWRQAFRGLQFLNIVRNQNVRIWTEHVVPMLRNRSVGVRGRAVNTLGRFGAKPHADKVLPLLKDQWADVRWQAVWALGRMGRKADADRIAPLAKDIDWYVRWRVAEALTTLKSDRKRVG